MDLALLNKQAVIGFLVTYGLQLAKGSKHPWLQWLNDHSDKANRFMSWLFAFVTSLGIVFGADGSLATGMQITITLPALTQLATSFVTVLVDQILLQEGIYRGVLKKKTQGLTSIPESDTLK